MIMTFHNFSHLPPPRRQSANDLSLCPLILLPTSVDLRSEALAAERKVNG